MKKPANKRATAATRDVSNLTQLTRSECEVICGGLKLGGGDAPLGGLVKAAGYISTEELWT